MSKSMVTAPRGGVGLAGEDEAGGELGGIEGEVAAQVDLAGDDTGAARSAHPALAGERQVGPDALGAVEDRDVARRAGPSSGGRRGRSSRRSSPRRLPARRARRAAGRCPRRRTARGGRARRAHRARRAPAGRRRPCRTDRTATSGRRRRRSTSAGRSTAELGGVETAAEQLRLARLARQHVDQLDPRRLAVLEVGELVGEHHRVRAPVAVEHRHPRAGVGEHGRRRSTGPA